MSEQEPSWANEVSRRRMKKCCILIILLLSGMFVRSDQEFTTEERLSFYFREITLTNGTSLSVTLREGNSHPLEVGNAISNSFRTAEVGQTFIVNQGESFLFRPMGVRKQSRIALLGREDLKDACRSMPSEFLGENVLVYLVLGDSCFVISPSMQKLYSLAENTTRDFKFPFRCLWVDDEEEGRWFTRRKDRQMAAWVLSQSLRAKKGAEILYERMSAVDTSNATPEQYGWRKVQVPVTDDLCSGIFKPLSVRGIAIFIGKRRNDQYVAAVSVEQGDGRARFFRFDACGRVRWIYTLAPTRESKEKCEAKKLAMAFEYSAGGQVSRAWSLAGKAGRLWRLTAGGLCPVSDMDVVREFYSDISKVMTSKFQLP